MENQDKDIIISKFKEILDEWKSDGDTVKAKRRIWMLKINSNKNSKKLIDELGDFF